MNISLSKDPASSTLYYPDHTNWDDLRFPAQGVNPPGAVSDPSVNASDGTLAFEKNAVNMIAGVAQMPHGWQEGSYIDAHIHWQAADGNSGDHVWLFEYDIANIKEDFAGSYVSLQKTFPSESSALKHGISSFGNIDMTGKKLSCIIKWRLSRLGDDAADTYDNDINLLELDFHYQIGSVGSGEERSK
jgi:hypothetical protein